MLFQLSQLQFVREFYFMERVNGCGELVDGLLILFLLPIYFRLLHS